ncbi:MAG: hypothetical protein LBK71_02860 [Verrucomicrobiales bacterium]|jgi:hypothetical protein|nr:hypothetical protein [Verrucomicrobiales bacterium]
MDSKEIERAELHKTIWRIANDLRGAVDGWDFTIFDGIRNSSNPPNVANSPYLDWRLP